MKIRNVLGETNAPIQSPQQAALLPAQSQTKRRCEQCKKEISDKGAKIAKNKLSKVLSQCQAYGKAVC